ncbi:secondary thiamine-phosphate synthase enzyme [Marinitoga hydrogenitolerans DSM 16785]|uniref:Secondary thiamine-phosphate synthase enzyme n=1 Tax=Marinitoga hydrogenitolerans (strain DSM 16785 / JCM 12826 / AT1271) TaxID=1122195 RepID=A0A1M4XL13_MARH1|nr:secondary thiamine-phosphate synthase enzyme YjbQ [Marinitoga hydrogenitolerans]SHE94130.1 secondary thiamine-phosphate synthase enzyme [Marinitoga hydrogenitolerans DSM 16785]
MLKEFSISTSHRNEFVDITHLIQNFISESKIQNGIAVIFVPHTTAGVTINENADPSVKKDMNEFLNKLIPKEPFFTHFEGNSDSHIKSTLVGPSLTLIINNNNILLGTWQGVYFCEFDGPRKRKFFVKLIRE